MELKIKYFNLFPLPKLNQRQAVLPNLAFSVNMKKYAAKVSDS